MALSVPEYQIDTRIIHHLLLLPFGSTCDVPMRDLIAAAVNRCIFCFVLVEIDAVEIC